MKMIRGKLSYANVVSTLCLFLLLGGGAAFAASQLGKNSVGTKQLKSGAVTTAKIKNGAVTGAKVKLSTLGKVPSAVSADALSGLTAAQISDGAKLRCPAGTKLGGGICVEEAARPAAPMLTALQTCGSVDRRLPSMGELIAYDVKYFTVAPPQEWVEPEYVDKGESPLFRGINLTARREPAGLPFVQIGVGSAESSNPYRCVTPPSNG